MKSPIFKTDKNDPTSQFPPRFLSVHNDKERMPTRIDLDAIIERAIFLNAKQERDAQLLEKRKKEMEKWIKNENDGDYSVRLLDLQSRNEAVNIILSEVN